MVFADCGVAVVLVTVRSAAVVAGSSDAAAAGRHRSIRRRTGACDDRRTEQQQWCQRRAPSGGGRETTNHPYSLAHARPNPIVTVAGMALDRAAGDQVNLVWDEIVPVLHDYIAIPNVSEAFDPEWREHGYMQQAVELIRGWCAARPIEGVTVEVHELPERSPVIVIEVAPFGQAGNQRGSDDTVLLYGHLDKQPEMEGWRDGPRTLDARAGR